MTGRRLLTPRWVIASVVVAVLAVTFFSLGLWQLRRMDEKKLENTVAASRFQDAPLEIELLVPAMSEDPETLHWRRATATGTFQPEDEVLMRSQVELGNAGFHVVTPLLLADGSGLLVNRGWVPLVLDEVPVTQAQPPSGTVTVEGWLAPAQTRRALGPEDPGEGRLVAMNRVDVARIQEQVDYPLLPMYMVEMGERGTDLPIPVDEPLFDDEGPHLAYAIQWFSFMVIGLVGYGFLMRRASRVLPSHPEGEA